MKTTTVLKRICTLCLALLTALSVLSVTVSAADAEEEFKLLYDFYTDEGPWGGYCSIIGYEGTVPQDLVIPSEAEGYGVCDISESAFAGCGTLRSVSGGSELAAIGTAAFADCTNLETVSFDGDFYDFTIHQNAFQDCKKLKSVSISAGNWYFSILDAAFFGCSALQEVTWHPAFIRDNAFFGCYSLKTVHFLGVKADGYYSVPDCMVNETGNSFYLYADKDWVNYPNDRSMETADCDVNMNVNETYAYTLHRKVEAGQHVEIRQADCCYDMIWAEESGQEPGVYLLQTWRDSEGCGLVVFVIVDENGNVVYEEYVHVSVTFSAQQKMRNSWNTLLMTLRRLFRNTLLGRVLSMFCRNKTYVMPC